MLWRRLCSGICSFLPISPLLLSSLPKRLKFSALLSSSLPLTPIFSLFSTLDFGYPYLALFSSHLCERKRDEAVFSSMFGVRRAGLIASAYSSALRLVHMAIRGRVQKCLV